MLLSLPSPRSLDAPFVLNQSNGPQPGCLYTNFPIAYGESFHQGVCYLTCVCGKAGKISCRERCPKVELPANDPSCVMVKDPRDECCSVAQCIEEEVDDEVAEESATDVVIVNAISEIIEDFHHKIKTDETIDQTFDNQIFKIKEESSLEQGEGDFVNLIAASDGHLDQSRDDEFSKDAIGTYWHSQSPNQVVKAPNHSIPTLTQRHRTHQQQSPFFSGHYFLDHAIICMHV